MHEDFTIKLNNLRSILQETQTTAILITLQHNFAWLTCGGRNYVGTHSEKGVATIFVDNTHVALLTNNIEAPRIIAEELKSCSLANKENQDKNSIVVYFEPWYDPLLSSPKALLKHYGLIASDEVVVETDESPKIAPLLCALRSSLSQHETHLYRDLGKDCGDAIASVARSLHRGVHESHVAALLAKACLEKNIVPVVLLIASDERIDLFRHPLPSYDKQANEKVMLVLCGRRHGLIASVTRLVHFGELPHELRRKHNAVTFVDAVAFANTVAGKKGSDVFNAMKKAYEETGYSDEWMLHHQGGATGYMSREWRGSPTSSNVIKSNNAFAWNPSITGTKSEDTILLLEDRTIEIITVSDHWPLVRHEIDGKVFERADILCLD
jgi:Xaa-Pro dipeptidase